MDIDNNAPKNDKGRSLVADDEKKMINRENTIRRIKKEVRQIINANYEELSTRIITLTFKENEHDLEKCHYEFKKFIQRYNYNNESKMHYIAFPEKQKRGAIHYHLIQFKAPEKTDLKMMRRIWKHGSVNVKLIKGNIKDVGSYVTKYLTKDNEWLIGKKAYFKSKGLQMPVEIKGNKKDLSATITTIKQIGYRQNYKSTFNGQHYDTTYTQLVKD